VTVRPASGAPPFDIGADAVVVAADALRTPQVLWASGIRPAALGRYLNDQPQVVAAAFVDGVEAAATGSGEAGEDQRDLLTGVTWLPFDDAAGRPYHGQIMQMDASPILIGGDAGADPRPVVGIGIFATKEPLPDDRVVIDETRPDAFGLPGIRIEYELTERDRDAINGAMDLAARVAKAVGEYIPDGEPRLLPAGTSIHYQGTVRMGPSDDGTSVCDTDSRVWGTANVYVGGNGVIPTATACNPTLTSVALAVRAARRIAAELGAEAGR
jgi:choline dehydrogenase-like flavoprotein